LRPGNRRRLRVTGRRFTDAASPPPLHRRPSTDASRVATMTIDHATARQNMVDGQIKPNRVTDLALMDAMREIPRELFVPAWARGVAYVDEDLRIGDDRWLMEPLVFARLVDAAEVQPSDRVLDIGCGTGYSTAVLARLADTVVAVEPDRELGRGAGETLTQLGIHNAAVVEGHGPDGFVREAPFDVIVLEGAIADVPDGLAGQLAEGGRLVAVMAPALERPGPGHGTLFLKVGGKLSRRFLFEAGTPVLPGFEPTPAFSF
jgi:protein-L-isoaspartate(D-aspartate) O-methyltransferase